RTPVAEEEALALAAEQLKAVDASKLAVVLSAQHTIEDNLALVRLAGALGTDRLYLAALGGWEGDDILRSEDNNPNRAGAKQAAGGATLKPVGELLADVQSGTVQGVLALGWATAEKLEELAPLVALDGVVSLTSHVGALPAAASVAIPGSSR
ncbi:MAG: NADH-quinone oxidoreductase subunit G, partial [Deltaproteobacteria bacterium]|nr:NADH-quinone oxidoreductase subunit G [Deltaproteobacteria bacterium]